MVNTQWSAKSPFHEAEDLTMANPDGRGRQVGRVPIYYSFSGKINSFIFMKMAYFYRKAGAVMKKCSDCCYCCKKLLMEALWRPFLAHLFYFLVLSFVGALVLCLSSGRNGTTMNALDAWFMSVSAVTVSSLGTVPMQNLTQLQLLVMTLLMFLGAEAFTSMLCLHIQSRLLSTSNPDSQKNNSHEQALQEISTLLSLQVATPPSSSGDSLLILMSTQGSVLIPTSRAPQEYIDEPKPTLSSNSCTQALELSNISKGYSGSVIGQKDYGEQDSEMNYSMGMSFLGMLALIYLLVVQLGGIFLILLYLGISFSSRRILHKAGVSIPVFALFTVVSTFGNCGFIPLNDNLMSFRGDGFVLWVLGMQILLGNTLYAPALWAVIWITGKLVSRNGRMKRMSDYLLKNGCRMSENLFPARVTLWLAVSVLGLVSTGTIFLCSMQWNTDLFEGFDSFQKVQAALFQAVSIRHSGENVVNPQLLYPAVAVLYIIMMFLPPYPLSWKEDQHSTGKVKIEEEKIIYHDATYLFVAVFAVCIIERQKLMDDPLNYKVLNIVFEVVSAYGNVGLSIGYSCELLSRYTGEKQQQCQDVGISFSGKWSPLGKLIIICVMFFGRFKSIRKAPLSNTWICNNKATEAPPTQAQTYPHPQLEHCAAAVHS